MSLNDLYGNPTSAANPEALHYHQQTLDDLLHFRGDLLGDQAKSLQHDPQLALGWAMKAYLGALGTEAADAQATAQEFDLFWQSAKHSQYTERERLHLAAAKTLLQGDWSGASDQLANISFRFPRDLMALFIGHQLDFFTGNSALLRDRIGGAITSWTPQDPHYANVLGMLAFGLEETGQYDLSEELGLEAVERNPKNVWAVHAVAHTYEMQARFAKGMQYMDQRMQHWASGNFYTVHNWWHYALYTIEAGQEDRALQIHDAALFTDDQAGLSLQLLDASALCWRLLLGGRIEQGRFMAQVQRWRSKAEPAFYAFNDMHMTMALVGAGLHEEAAALIQSRERWLATNPDPRQNNVSMTKRVGVPVCKGLLAFGQGKYQEAVDHLFPVRRILHEAGGSHAQRDAVLQTLLEAALRAGNTTVAQNLVSERISVRPRSPYNWYKHAELLERMGQAAQAALSRTRAEQYRKA